MISSLKSKRKAVSSFIEGFLDAFDVFGLSPLPERSLPRMKTPEEMFCEAWDQTYESLWSAFDGYVKTHPLGDSKDDE
jgi:hypothetical protein